MYFPTSAGFALLQKRQKRLPRIPVLVIGLGEDAFIGPTAWIRFAFALGVFVLKYAAPSRKPENVSICQAQHDLVVGNVDSDYKALVKRAVADEGKKLVVFLCTETPGHHEQLKFLIEAGVKIILLDKPPVEKFEHWQEVNDLAKKHGVLMLVSYQHTLCAPVELLARISQAHIAQHGADSVEVDGFFLQEWLWDPPMQIRQVWRLLALFGGLLDIGTHAANLLEKILGKRIVRVLRSCHGKARSKQLDAPAFDNGRIDVQFDGGVIGQVRYHQALKGHADDIGAKVTLKFPCGRKKHYLFRMEVGAGETLFESDGDGNMDDPGQWKRHLRGHSPLYPADVNDAFGLQPPGHTQGWGEMWQTFFMRAYAQILIHLGDAELANLLKPVFKGRVPTFAEDGGQSMAFVKAAEESHALGRPVDLVRV